MSKYRRSNVGGNVGNRSNRSTTTRPGSSYVPWWRPTPTPPKPERTQVPLHVPVSSQRLPDQEVTREITRGSRRILDVETTEEELFDITSFGNI